MHRDDPSLQPPAGRRDARPDAEHATAERYEIRVAGRMSGRWGAWFDHLDLTDEGDGTTVLHGPIADQAALHGHLQQLRDLGLPLLSVTRTAPGAPIEQPISPTTDDHTTTPGATP